MALIDLRAEIGQPVCNRREPQIRTGYGVAQRKQHFGDSAHADAADAHQMNTLEIVKGSGHGRATSSIKSTIFSAAWGRASARARVPSSTSLAGWSMSARISRARRRSAQFRLGNQPGRPGAHQFLGIAHLVAIRRGAEGDEDGRAAGGGNFGDGDRAGTADDQVGVGETFRHAGEKRGYFRFDIRSRVSFEHGIVVALAGLMNDFQAVSFVGRKIFSASITARFTAREPWLPPVIKMR